MYYYVTMVMEWVYGEYRKQQSPKLNFAPYLEIYSLIENKIISVNVVNRVCLVILS